MKQTTSIPEPALLRMLDGPITVDGREVVPEHTTCGGWHVITFRDEDGQLHDPDRGMAARTWLSGSRSRMEHYEHGVPRMIYQVVDGWPEWSERYDGGRIIERMEWWSVNHKLRSRYTYDPTTGRHHAVYYAPDGETVIAEEES
jgi:hypothetical protein